MLEDPIEAPAETSPGELLARYESALADVVDSLGAAHVAERTGLDAGTVAAVGSGDSADLDLRDAAEILSLRDDAPDADAILSAARERLLLGMSTAMLDVDRVAADVEGDMDAKEVQGKLEGRHPMTLAEYARLHHFIAAAD